MVAECQNRNNQMITKEDYKNLKEYYDYQRKQAYNKEVVFAMAEKFEGRVYNDFGMVNMKDMKDLLWVRVKPEDYEEPSAEQLSGMAELLRKGRCRMPSFPSFARLRRDRRKR